MLTRTGGDAASRDGEAGISVSGDFYPNVVHGIHFLFSLGDYRPLKNGAVFVLKRG